MIEIKDLLLRFNNILLSEESKKEAIKKTINNILGLDIKKEEIEIKNNIIYLNIKPIYKNEIFIKKDKIISELETCLGSKHPKEIR